MELSEGITIVKPPKRASTFDTKPTREQLQRTIPQADVEGALVLSSPPDQTKQWALEIWQSQNTQQSYTALKEVVHSYNCEAGAEDLVRIQETMASFIDVRNVAFAAREKRLKDSAGSNKILRKMRTGLDKFCSTVYNYCPIVDVMANAAPEYAQLAWGVIRFLLIMKINSAELKETVMQKLGDIGEQFEVIRCFLGLYPSAAMAKHVCGAYEGFTKFLTEAVKYYKENCIKRVFKNITHPYALRFDPLIQNINGHVAKVKEAAAVGQGLAIAENTAITRQTRAMIAAGHWKLDENNQALKGLTAMMEAARQQLEWHTQAAEEVRVARQRDEFDPFETSRSLLSERGFGAVLKLIRPTEISASDNMITDDLARLNLINSAKGADSRTYERLGLLDNKEIKAWVESRQSRLLWIDGFLARPDWTTQLSLDVVSTAKQAGNATLSFMCSEHDESCRLHNPVAWAWNFIEQLVSQRPEFFTFEKQCMVVTSLIMAKQDFKAVWQVLATCIRDINFGFIYLVIDNIDIAFGGPANAELQDLLIGLQHLSQIRDRVVKILITSRRAISDDLNVPSGMIFVPVAPRAHLSKSRPQQKTVLAAVRKPKQRIPTRLPDRETTNDVTLSDESSWDDDKLEEMLETTDEEGKKPKRRRDKKRKASLAKAASDSDSLKLDSDSAEGSDSDIERTKKVPIGSANSSKSKTRPKPEESDLDSDDSLDSLDSLASLDSLDEALKTSSDEDSPKTTLPKMQQKKPEKRPKPSGTTVGLSKDVLSTGHGSAMSKDANSAKQSISGEAMKSVESTDSSDLDSN